MADAADQGQLVGLEAHPGAAPETQAPAGQFPGNVGGIDGQPGGDTLDYGHQGLAMGLAGS